MWGEDRGDIGGKVREGGREGAWWGWRGVREGGGRGGEECP